MTACGPIAVGVGSAGGARYADLARDDDELVRARGRRSHQHLQAAVRQPRPVLGPAAVQARGATSLYLFGSCARNEAKPDSDIDLFVDYDPARRFSLVDLAAVQSLLEDRLTAKIDLTTRDSLHPLLRDGIERSAVRVF